VQEAEAGLKTRLELERLEKNFEGMGQTKPRRRWRGILVSRPQDGGSDGPGVAQPIMLLWGCGRL